MKQKDIQICLKNVIHVASTAASTIIYENKTKGAAICTDYIDIIKMCMLHGYEVTRTNLYTFLDDSGETSVLETILYVIVKITGLC